MARPADVHQYRFPADSILDACRVQHDRITGLKSASRHDIDFYLLSVARLHELTRKTATKLQLPGADDLLKQFEDRFPLIKDQRDWLMHPAEVDRVKSVAKFSDTIHMRFGQGTLRVLGADDQPAVEAFYLMLCDLLGELPP